MRSQSFLSASLVIATAILSVANANPNPLRRRSAAPDNTVHITSTEDYCLILPRTPHTNIGDSEHDGGMQSYCSNPYDSSQGQLPSNFWSNVHLERPSGEGRIIQLTGCINPETSDRLNTSDDGGQYDSSGGEGGRGNPANSVCSGYNHYVEIVEPSARRACIRCCDEFDDCPVSMDTSGCPQVIPGRYDGCS